MWCIGMHRAGLCINWGAQGWGCTGTRVHDVPVKTETGVHREQVHKDWGTQEHPWGAPGI